MKWYYLKLLVNMNRFRNLVISRLIGGEILKEGRGILENYFIFDTVSSFNIYIFS